MNQSTLDLLKKLIKMVDFSKIKTNLIIYLILVIVYLPIETIILPYMIISKISKISSKNFNKSKIINLIVFFLLTFSVLKIIEYFRYRLGVQIQNRTYIDIKEKMMDQIMDIYKNVQKELPLGRIINHMENVPFLVEQILHKFFSYLVPETICLIAVVIFLFYIDLTLGFIGLFFLVIYTISLFRYIKEPQNRASQEAGQRAKHNQSILNMLDNMLYILISNSFGFEKNNFKTSNENHHQKLVNWEIANSNLFKRMDIISVIFISVLCWRLYTLIIKKNNQNNLVKYTSVFIILLFFMEKVTDFKFMFTNIATFIHSSEVFLKDLDILNQDDKTKFNLTTFENPKPDLAIEVKNLNYTYPKAKYKIFSNKNFSFKKNQLIAIQGESGCGKTTLGKIIIGLNNPNTGSIFIDSENLTGNYKKRQKKVGYIPQNVKLFEGSLLDNIRYTCKKTISLKKLDSWINKQGVKHILMKNKDDFGYLSRNVGVAGSELSGGQKQITIILRTFLSNLCSTNKKQIFILDEPTSALDPDTSQIIIKLLNKLSKKYTIIIITHDKNIAKQCHQIIKL